MKANELRIGNYIKFHNTITKVEGFSIWDNLIQSDNFAERELKDFEPIPLTEEWLLKVDWNVYNYLCINSYFELDKYGHLYYQNDYTGINIKYLHQLQNLYFALTAEELTIKPNE
jgi:hypothetical protein